MATAPSAPDLAAALAVEVDRTSIAVYRRIGPNHRAEIKPAAADAGQPALAFLLGFGDFLAAGALTPELVRLRTRYYDHEGEVANTESLREAGLIEGTPMQAVGALRKVIDLAYAARATEAEELWGHVSDKASRIAAQLDAGLASLDPSLHPLAFAHQLLPTQPMPCDALVQQLVTLRYIRMDDHARAWSEAGKTAGEMVALSADYEAGTLSEADTQEREAIEEQTNRYNATSLSTVTNTEDLLADLQQLPT